MTHFFKYPSTPHLISHEGVTRKDKVLTPSDCLNFLKNDLIVEEKIDGANIGFSRSLDGNIQVQNRGSILEKPYRGQFSRLSSWLAINMSQIQKALVQDIILFGEWCAAKHSIEYNSLPDLFILFDVYNFVEKAFWSVSRRNKLAASMGLKVPRKINLKQIDVHSLARFVRETNSAYSNSAIEGIILRHDAHLWNISRAKFVRRDFTQSINEHWSKSAITWNQVRG